MKTITLIFTLLILCSPLVFGCYISNTASPEINALIRSKTQINDIISYGPYSLKELKEMSQEFDENSIKFNSWADPENIKTVETLYKSGSLYIFDYKNKCGVIEIDKEKIIWIQTYQKESISISNEPMELNMLYPKEKSTQQNVVADPTSHGNF